MLISSFHAALMLIAKYFIINILQNKLVDSSKLLFSELAHCIRQELIMHQLVDSILLVSNLRFFAFFLCVQITYAAVRNGHGTAIVPADARSRDPYTS